MIRSAFGLLLLWAAPAAAEPVTLSGITFSDELGGFVLESGSGSGTAADPFVIVERITGEEAAVLVVRGLDLAFGNRAGTHHLTGFALSKVVVNGTGRPWQEYRVELQQVLGSDSPFGDGLSFGQGPEAASRAIGVDRFGRAVLTDEPYDVLSATDGLVEPGGQAVFQLVITDTTPTAEFYVVQRRGEPVARLAPLPSAPYIALQ